MQGIVRVRGQVQGVGFRPFVYRLARELDLQGWVRNDSKGVEISIAGEEDSVSDFLSRLGSENPSLSRVEKIEFVQSGGDEIHSGFSIRESLSGAIDTRIPPDVSICRQCLAELFDPMNRRYRHPFINCTHCGPRYTLVSGIPYDRKETSMAKFSMCESCLSEYHDPFDRRFHAQPNACNDCGPEIGLFDREGKRLKGDIIGMAMDAILSGKILAVKGIGGFHLACDANNGEAVRRLRRSKARLEKPLAVMAANVLSLSRHAFIGEEEGMLLESRERPILLLEKKREIEGIAEGVSFLGAMLPYSALHYLLFHEAAGRPEGLSWLDEFQDLILVATSANPGGEPLVKENGEALERLAGHADLFLVHDREILVRCDDSVMRWNGKMPQFIRRARGYAPSSIGLPFSGPSVLATGSGYKNTVCVTRASEAFVSQHVGDLDNAMACSALEDAVEHLLGLLETEPEIVAHDLHPDFYSTRFARQFSERLGIPAIGIQHHHAHVAAVMAEHGVNEPVVGLALDGTGLGNDGKAWGGELLFADEKGEFSRLGHIAEILLPGGDAASREPWRLAAGFLYSCGLIEEMLERYGKKGEAIFMMLDRKFNSPRTSSMGRLFDTAAGLLRISDRTSFEGQAAMLLEKMARHQGPVPPLENGFHIEEGILDFSPLLEALAETDNPGYGASLFHTTLVEGLKCWVNAHTGQCGQVVFSGGCFMNGLLSLNLRRMLEEQGHVVLEAERVPPNDGGISLGQAYVAMQRKLSCV